MTKDDNSGLLSKMVRFVRNPTTNWSDLDEQDSDRESRYSKQMLKEMIERKRRNDFVRKREFDMLRKMRRSEAMGGQDVGGGRPSFFQSSMPSTPDDRAMTIKKIDEIEAQMSMQWWKTKNGDAGRTTNFPVSSMPPEQQAATPRVRPPSAEAPAQVPGSPIAYTKTEPAPLPTSREHGGDEPDSFDQDDDVRQVSPASAAPSVFETAKPFDAAVNVEEFVHDPELEEAAIRFANSDDEGAEAGLLEVLSPSGSRIEHEETWLTLFDLYRATGSQQRFEEAAIDFASRFNRSAPQWFSLPDLVARMRTPKTTDQESRKTAHWTCPSSLGTQTVAAMAVALGKAAPPWILNWSKLSVIEAASVEPLARLFLQWGSETKQIRFMGADVLESVLEKATPSGDKSVSESWWRLRMELLRLMHRPDEFELVALDYCVTYEVSPPSWTNSLCHYKPLQLDGSEVESQSIIGDVFTDSVVSGPGSTFGTSEEGALNGRPNAVSTVELSGHIEGDATETLDKLEQRFHGAETMVISCARLVRIDFAAAGTVLNWVSSQHDEGRQIQFTQVHRLVAAFFSVIGINEYAKVSIRPD